MYSEIIRQDCLFPNLGKSKISNPEDIPTERGDLIINRNGFWVFAFPKHSNKITCIAYLEIVNHDKGTLNVFIDYSDPAKAKEVIIYLDKYSYPVEIVEKNEGQITNTNSLYSHKFKGSPEEIDTEWNRLEEEARLHQS